MARGKNAQLAVDLYENLRRTHGWSKSDAWKGIALLLLTCEKWGIGWGPFHDVVVYRETNDYKTGPKGHGAILQRAEALTVFLAQELGVPRADLCRTIAQYWAHPNIRALQPHNPVGHAFRSVVVKILQTYGKPGITFEEEVDPRKEFPGHVFSGRSKNPKIDIVARNAANQTVAIITARWRFRHDRVDVVDEALAYLVAARRTFPNCRFYAMLGEFSPARLEKVLEHCAPIHKNPPITATVHFNPELLTRGLGENGRMAHLKSLAWLIDETLSW